MQRIILPQVQFSEATLEEAVEFFRVKSKALDTSEPDPARRGVKFLLRKGAGNAARITLDLKDVPLMEALRYTTELAGIPFRVEPFAVMIGIAPARKIQFTSSAPSPTPAPQLTGKPLELGRKIILPQVQLRETSLEEALEFIRVQVTTACERMKIAPLNIVLKPGAPNNARITLDLKDVPLAEALRYIAELANHTLRSDEHSFIIEPQASTLDKSKPTAGYAHLEEVIIPQVHFANVTLEEAIDLLRTNYRNAAEGKSLGLPSIITKGEGHRGAKFSLDLKNVTFLTALKYVAELSNHSLHYEPYAIILTSK